MVELSDHSIQIDMVSPSRTELAWDDNLYKHGNVFVRGYANPIKPSVNATDSLDDPDTVELDGPAQSGTQRDTVAADGGEAVQEKPHVQVMSSQRYKTFMMQELIESLLMPETKWRRLLLAIIAVIVLQFLGMIITLFATGSF